MCAGSREKIRRTRWEVWYAWQDVKSKRFKGKVSKMSVAQGTRLKCACIKDMIALLSLCFFYFLYNLVIEGAYCQHKFGFDRVNRDMSNEHT